MIYVNSFVRYICCCKRRTSFAAAAQSLVKIFSPSLPYFVHTLTKPKGKGKHILLYIKIFQLYVYYVCINPNAGLILLTYCVLAPTTHWLS